MHKNKKLTRNQNDSIHYHHERIERLHLQVRVLVWPLKCHIDKNEYNHTDPVTPGTWHGILWCSSFKGDWYDSARESEGRSPCLPHLVWTPYHEAIQPVWDVKW